MLTPEEKTRVLAQHAALEDAVSKLRKPKSAEWYELMWERTLSEVSGARYDMVLGVRLLFAELQAANSKQAFLDAAVIKIIAGLTDPGPQREQFAREAYDMAEILWAERRQRLQGTPSADGTAR